MPFLRRIVIVFFASCSHHSLLCNLNSIRESRQPSCREPLAISAKLRRPFKSFQGGANHIMRIVSTNRLGQNILNSGNFENRAYRRACNDSSSFWSWLHQHLACSKVTNDLMRNCGAFQWNLHQILLSLLASLLDRFWNFASFAEDLRRLGPSYRRRPRLQRS